MVCRARGATIVVPDPCRISEYVTLDGGVISRDGHQASEAHFARNGNGSIAGKYAWIISAAHCKIAGSELLI